MGGNNERNAYRVVVLVIAVLGALGLLWVVSEGSGFEGGQGIFQFLPDPTNGHGIDPGSAE